MATPGPNVCVMEHAATINALPKASTSHTEGGRVFTTVSGCAPFVLRLQAKNLPVTTAAFDPICSRRDKATPPRVFTFVRQRLDGAVHLRCRQEPSLCGRFPRATIGGNADASGRTPASMRSQS